jgi:arylsulfatase A-like enzyme
MSRSILKTIASLTIVSWCLAAGAAQRPNILIIISDDIGLDVSTSMYPGLVDELARQYGPAGLDNPGWQSIHGRPASLPNLARLARQGTSFTHAWAQPFCSPTRASLLTGLHAGKAKVLSYADPLSPSYTSFVRQLKDQGGYSTALFGKWHLAGVPGNQGGYPGMKPKQAGFDLFRGNMHAAIRTYWDYEYQVQDATSPADQWRTEKPPARSLPGIAATTYAPVVKVADAIDWITAREQAHPGKPWLAWVAFNLAHATIVQTPSAMAVPNIDTLDATSIAEMKACGGEFGSMNTGKCSGEALQRVMSNAMDTMTGKLLAAVDGLDRNTIVIYLGDNGTPMYGRPNLDFIDNMYITRKGRGKGTVYESGARVPLVIRGPGIGAKRVSGEYVHVADLYPTILTLAGLAPPARVSNSDGSGTLVLDGVSLVPILKGKATRVRDPDRGYMLTESLNLMTESTRDVGARDGRYKVMCHENTAAGSCQYFDLQKDPLEEYPLPVPASCDSQGDRPADPGWHFCRLRGLIATESFLSQARPTVARTGRTGPTGEE